MIATSKLDELSNYHWQLKAASLYGLALSYEGVDELSSPKAAKLMQMDTIENIKHNKILEKQRKKCASQFGVINKIKIITLIFLLVCISGCVTMSDISENKESRSLIGNGTLKSDVFICSVPSDELHHESLPKIELYQNHGFDRCPYGRHVGAISAGTPLTVSAVKIVKAYGPKPIDHWYLIGLLSHQDNIVDFHFHYGLGHLSDGKPFEAKSLPWSLSVIE